MGEKERGHQGTCIKDIWIRPKGGRIEGGRWGSVQRVGGVGGAKWRHLYLNDNKKEKDKRKALCLYLKTLPIFTLERGVCTRKRAIPRDSFYLRNLYAE